MQPNKPKVLATIEIPADRFTPERQIACEDDVKEILRKVAPQVRMIRKPLFITFETK